MKAKFLLLLTALTASAAFAQKGRITFHPSVQAGLLEGERGGALQLQTVQGLNYKTWSVGIGAGLDCYHTRSVPVFLDVRKALAKKEQRPFVYVDGGYHFPWLTAADEEAFIYNAKGGLYCDAGIGYEFPVAKGRRFFFAAGFSQKRFSEDYDTMLFLSVWAPPRSAYETRSYRTNRLSVKAGLLF